MGHWLRESIKNKQWKNYATILKSPADIFYSLYFSQCIQFSKNSKNVKSSETCLTILSHILNNVYEINYCTTIMRNPIKFKIKGWLTNTSVNISFKSKHYTYLQSINQLTLLKTQNPTNLVTLDWLRAEQQIFSALKSGGKNKSMDRKLTCDIKTRLWCWLIIPWYSYTGCLRGDFAILIKSMCDNFSFFNISTMTRCCGHAWFAFWILWRYVTHC